VKEPITIIDKRDRRNQYSPYINLAEGETIEILCLFLRVESQQFGPASPSACSLVIVFIFIYVIIRVEDDSPPHLRVLRAFAGRLSGQLAQSRQNRMSHQKFLDTEATRDLDHAPAGRISATPEEGSHEL
jgi:hypothetical protein